MAGRKMHLLSPKEGTYITIKIHITALNSLERGRRLKSYFLDKPPHTILELELQIINDGEKLLKQTYKRLQTYPGFIYGQ